MNNGLVIKYLMFLVRWVKPPRLVRVWRFFVGEIIQKFTRNSRLIATRNVLLCVCMAYGLLPSSHAQIPIGTWQTHFNYQKARCVALVEGKVYCSTGQGFFFYDPTAKESSLLSKVDELAENGISQLKYLPDSKVLMVAYESGNLDLLEIEQGEPSQITNLPLLKETSAIQGSKRINQITIRDGKAYLSADFGLVVVDIAKKEIQETYKNIGTNGATLNVYAVAFANDSLYAATSQGLLGAKFSAEVNLQFFGSWKTVAFAGQKVNSAATRNGILYIGVSERGVFQYNNGRTSTVLASSEVLTTMQVFDTQLYVNLAKRVLQVGIDNQFVAITDKLLVNPQQTQSEVSAKLWIADGQNGLIGNVTGKFELYSPVSNDTLYRYRRDSIIADGNGFRWTCLDVNRGGGIEVFDTKTSRRRYLSTFVGEGGLPNSNVRSLALDQNGQIWAATDQGVAVFDNSFNVFSGIVNAYRPISQNRYLLANELVTAIAIDGGNRKWIGTRNGLFLFSSDGADQLLSFTEKNSPLPSSEISSLAIEPMSGEVYVRTPRGMVSYRSTATEGAADFSGVKVFPNPVRPEFNGLIGISGLVENAFVKITDTAGRLIYETHAAGGTAVWNARDPQGHRAETGVYLIFMTGTDGTERLVSKLAVVK